MVGNFPESASIILAEISCSVNASNNFNSALPLNSLSDKLEILEIDKWNHTLIPSAIRIVGAVILAPITEELFFRGIFLHKLVGWKLNKHLAIFIQSCIFVSFHAFAYQNNLASNIGIVQTFVDATLFGYAKYQTKSIYTPIAMHMTGNLIATLERFIL